MKLFLPTLIITLITLSGTKVWAQPNLTSQSPIPNNHTTALNSQVVAGFDVPMDLTSVNNGTFVVHGNMRGYRTATYSTSGNNIILTPTIPFMENEVVDVLAEASLTDMGATPFGQDFHWQFRAAAGVGPGTFFDAGQSLGTGRSIGVSMGDIDGDGDIDAFVANDNQGNVVWLNDGTGTFFDAGQSLGTGRSFGVSMGDIDGMAI